MKTRAIYILTMTVSASILLASQGLSASNAAAPSHAKSGTEQSDTIVYSATKSLIESVGELSKTASKLSEAALKLLESQETPVINKAQDRQYNNTDEPTADPVLDEYIFQEEYATQEDHNIENPTPTYSGSKVYISDEVTTPENTIESIWYLPDVNKEDGKYVWVPESRTSAVEAVLAGNGYVPGKTDNEEKINLNEKVYWHGDSIYMAIKTKRLGRYDRKLYNWLIYPKGLWHLSLTANYGELSTDDSEFLSLIQDVDLKGKLYSIKPSVSYFLRHNVCVGLRLAFTKGEMGINSFKVDIDEDMSFNLHDIKYTADSYSAAIFIQQYFGLTRRGRFAVFNEAEVSVGTGSSHFIRPFDGNIRDTRTKTQSFNINYSPGVSIMMMKNAAFNLSFGIFGFHLKSEKQWENGEESGSRFTSGINFRFNLFNINFGVSIII